MLLVFKVDMPADLSLVVAGVRCDVFGSRPAARGVCVLAQTSGMFRLLHPNPKVFVIEGQTTKTPLRHNDLGLNGAA